MSPASRKMTVDHDLVVIGGGPGGSLAASTAVRADMGTYLGERAALRGGAAASGLGIPARLDRSRNDALDGIAQELIDHLTDLGGSPGRFRCPVHGSIRTVPERSSSTRSRRSARSPPSWTAPGRSATASMPQMIG